MSSAEKLCLNWNDFQENILSSFKDLRHEKEFTDVTLACEDGVLEAHKVVLSFSSPWFKTLFGKIMSTQSPLIYMRGFKTRELESVMDFIYQGEANVLQEDLEAFLKIGQDLQLKGLQSNAEESQIHQRLVQPKIPLSAITMHSEKKHTEPDFKKLESYGFSLSQDAIAETEIQMAENQPAGQNADSEDNPDDDAKNLIETAKKIEAMLKKDNYLWRCAVCDFSSRAKTHLKEHVETHIESLKYPCSYCGKITATTNALRKHILRVHN